LNTQNNTKHLNTTPCPAFNTKKYGILLHIRVIRKVLYSWVTGPQIVKREVLKREVEKTIKVDMSDAVNKLEV
jgi:hypothetical protein